MPQPVIVITSYLCSVCWVKLTAREHLLLTAAFKGLPAGPALLQAVEAVLASVELLDRAA